MEQPAGFWIRLGASLLDGIILGIPLAILGFLVFGDGDQWFVNIVQFLYSLILPVIWNGYTIGKRICGIRIRKVDTEEAPTIGTMLLRNVVAGLVYGLTLGIAAIVSAFMVGLREDKRAIHDLIAGTEVVQG